MNSVAVKCHSSMKVSYFIPICLLLLVCGPFSPHIFVHYARRHILPTHPKSPNYKSESNLCTMVERFPGV